MKYKTKDKDYTGCNPDIAAALQSNKIILCKVWNTEDLCHGVYVSDYRKERVYSYIAEENEYKYAVPVPINQKVLPIGKLLKVLADNKYGLNLYGGFSSPDADRRRGFSNEMFKYCGKHPGRGWTWEPEWLEVEDA